MKMVICSMVMMILYILFERGQNEADQDKNGHRLDQSILIMTSNCCLKCMLCWERGFVFLSTELEKMLWIPSKIIRFKFESRRPPVYLDYIQEGEILKDKMGTV